MEFRWGLVCDDSMRVRGCYVSEYNDDDGIHSVTFYGMDDRLDSLVCRLCAVRQQLPPSKH